MARSAQLSRLTRKLEAIPQRVREAVAPALEKSGNELVETMQHLAPEDTGALKESITMTPGGQATPPYSQPGGSQIVPLGAVAITVGNEDVRYGHLVEYGTTETEAHPFFWPSYRLHKKSAGNRIKRALRKAVKDGWKS